MVRFTSIDLKKAKVSTLVIPVCEDIGIHEDPVISAMVATARSHDEFKGRKKTEIHHLIQRKAACVAAC